MLNTIVSEAEPPLECSMNATISLGQALSHLEDLRRTVSRRIPVSDAETRRSWREFQNRLERRLDRIGDKIRHGGRGAVEDASGEVRNLSLRVHAFLACRPIFGAAGDY